MSFFVFDASPNQDENGTVIDQMYISYDKGRLALHIDTKFKNALGFTEEVWKSLKQELESVLKQGKVYMDYCERVFSLRLHGAHHMDINDNDVLTVKMKLVGKSDRGFYDKETARRFTTMVSSTIIELQNSSGSLSDPAAG